MHGEVQRTDPRIFARPFELRRGQSLTRAPDDRPAQRSRLRAPPEPRCGRRVRDRPRRPGDRAARRRSQGASRSASCSADGGRQDADPGRHRADRGRRHARQTADLALDAPLITALVPEGREKRRDVPLAAIPAAHGPGGPRDRGSPLLRPSRHRSDRHRRAPSSPTSSAASEYLRGGSTLTQQLVKNTFLTQEKTPQRKFTEWLMSIVLERRLSKDRSSSSTSTTSGSASADRSRSTASPKRRGCSSARTSATCR